jgi:translation elongation factor P/translation initiation factor 5A
VKIKAAYLYADNQGYHFMDQESFDPKAANSPGAHEPPAKTVQLPRYRR